MKEIFLHFSRFLLIALLTLGLNNAQAATSETTVVNVSRGTFSLGWQFRLLGASDLGISETTAALGRQSTTIGLGGTAQYFVLNRLAVGLNLGYSKVSVSGADSIGVISFGPLATFFPWSGEHFALKTYGGYLREAYSGVKTSSGKDQPDRNLIVLGTGLTYFVSQSLSIGPVLHYATDLLDGKSPPSHRLAALGELGFLF